MSTPTETWTPTEHRAVNLQTLHRELLDRKARVADFVVSASELRLNPVTGLLHANNVQHDITPDGVTTLDSTHPFQMSDLAHADLAARLDVPMRYYRRMMEEELPFLLSTNVNYWMEGDDRKFMLRSYAIDGQPSYLRAILSDRYSRMDDEDMLAATLMGIRDAGIDPQSVSIDGDVTEKRLRVRITAPSVGIDVGDLLTGYRSPFGGGTAADLPMMWAGLEVTNSETGRGAFAITPRVVLQVCSNGMLRRMDLTRRTHLGERLEEGAVEWSAETQRRTLELVQSKARDAVSTFLHTDYLHRVATEMREASGQIVTQPLTTLTRAAKATGLNEGETNDLIGLFAAGGDVSTLGVGHAVTALAQRAEDSDRSADLEAAFWGIVTEANAIERSLA